MLSSSSTILRSDTGDALTSLLIELLRFPSAKKASDVKNAEEEKQIADMQALEKIAQEQEKAAVRAIAVKKAADRKSDAAKRRVEHK